MEAERALVALPDFKSGARGEEPRGWVRFPCASAIFCSEQLILQQLTPCVPQLQFSSGPICLSMEAGVLFFGCRLKGISTAEVKSDRIQTQGGKADG